MGLVTEDVIKAVDNVTVIMVSLGGHVIHVLKQTPMDHIVVVTSAENVHVCQVTLWSVIK